MREEASEHTTTDQEEIRKWVERYKGRPEIIDDPTAEADKRTIRINFPGEDDDLVSPRLTRKVSWEEFFEEFERLQYAFSYQDEIAKRSHPSNAFHFVPRGNL